MGSSNSLTKEDMCFGELSPLLKGLLMLLRSTMVTLFLRVRMKGSCQANEDEANKAKDEVELKELNNTDWLIRRSVKSHVKRIASSK
ncbi:hypothetical protein VitviT2T_019637 [Vitis vinifera]|uniref:Uncharacterized protein n=1 Tax=Vitis vinifera TaxID=29760 RepID=A0ABY9D151_VITVI|nr:hypothetical protein VitviT2T_019637 [Vitis vinifera]